MYFQNHTRWGDGAWVDFARDLGVIVPPAEIAGSSPRWCGFISSTAVARTASARASNICSKRWSFDRYLALVRKKLGTSLRRAPHDVAQMRWASRNGIRVGDYPQKQEGFSYVGATCPVGHITPKQMLRVAELAELYGNGEVAADRSGRIASSRNVAGDAFVPA